MTFRFTCVSYTKQSDGVTTFQFIPAPIGKGSAYQAVRHGGVQIAVDDASLFTVGDDYDIAAAASAPVAAPTPVASTSPTP